MSNKSNKMSFKISSEHKNNLSDSIQNNMKNINDSQG
jgi:hypothetical protein